jgi:EAL domain-containing protein (putative c-di-GMP-specific phosphodiesterase class I)/GGDEF domain-containing protein
MSSKKMSPVSWRQWATPIAVASSATSAPLGPEASVRNRLFPKTRSWFALDAPLALLSPLSVLRLMFALATVTWTMASLLWPSDSHRNWVVVLTASALVVWVALLEVRRIRVVWCWALIAVWIVQVSVLVWSGHGSGLTLAGAAFYVPVGVFAAVFFRLRTVAICQGAIAVCLWLVRMGDFGVGRAAFAAVVVSVCLSTAPLTVMLFNKSIRRIGMVDPETGLPNSLGIAQRLDQRDQAVPLIVVSVFVRGIDSAREALGYQAGTELLRRAIENIGQVLPSVATIGRLEADQLVIVQSLPGVAIDPDDPTNGIPGRATDMAAEVVETVERAVESGRYVVDGVEVALRAHAGISIAPWDGLDARELLRRASVSAKQAVTDGAPFVLWGANSSAWTADDLAMLADLGSAAERGELALAFQPQMDARTGAIVGAEALLRWRSPTRGEVSPALFIPLAERIGLINRLTEWVLPSALDAQALWRRRGLTISTSVNLSPVTLTRHDLADWVVGELRVRDLPPACLTLEITETAAADLSQAIMRLRPLQARGVRISVDDFGSGYTSLSALPTLPLDELKVDQQFVRRSAQSHNDLVIVRTVSELAKRLGLVAVAEGVETAELARDMAELGYDVLQGFYAARPMPADEFFRFALDHRAQRMGAARDLTRR